MDDEHEANILPLIDLRALPGPQREGAALSLASVEAGRPFDLARGPLLRAALLRLRDDEHVLLLMTHHIISDGWSLGVLIREVAALYAEAATGRPAGLPDLPIQYADYALWQRKWLQGEGDDTGSPLQAQLAYWKRQLAGLPALDLPTDRPRPPRAGYQGSTYAFTLPAELRAGLLALSKREGVTLFMTLLTAFQALLARYSDQDDLAVGAPIANRAHPATEPLIGFFVNTLVLRADLAGDPDGRALLRRVRESCLGAYAHQDVPFEQVVEALAPSRDLGRHPLFQVMFALQNAPLPPLELPRLTLQALSLPVSTTRFDLTLMLSDDRAGLSARMEYRTDLFEEATIARMAGHFERLLHGLVTQPERPVAALPLLSDAERQQIVVAWNATASAELPATLDQLIAEQVAHTPDAIALVCEEVTNGERRMANDESEPSSFVVRPSSTVHLTYAKLNARANQLAHYLRARGVGPDTPVAAQLARSPELLIALLGVLKAGGAYVPLDPAYPAARLAFMLEDAQPAVLLTARTDEGRTTNNESEPSSFVVRPSFFVDLQVVNLRADWPRIARQPETRPRGGAAPDNLAYVIYTSGSTGTPKGVMISHRSIANRLRWMQQTYQLGPDDRVLHKTPISFDVSVWELFWPLLAGAPLVLAAPGRHADSLYLADLIGAQRVTTLHFVPSLLRVFLETPGLAACRSLKRVICSGEALGFDLQARFFALLDAELHNLYGPTEAAVDVTAWRCVRGGSPERVPIGRPIANTQTYVLDRRLQPAPVGVAGELYIGGVQLARGYLGRPDLTAERFIPNPFAPTKDEGRRTNDEGPDSSFVIRPSSNTRLYKTGDRARYRADGVIEYLGRLDGQIKLRGVRIELGEVEATLRTHPNVAACAVSASEDRLVAYVVPTADERRRTKDEGSDSSFVVGPSSFVTELRGFLAARLPDTMIPGLFVPLDALPLTPSGKLDHRALPAPDWSRPDAAASYVAPRTPVESQLARLWAELLKVEQVGIYDNFFSLGGHSLLATQLNNRLHQTFGVELPLHRLFEAPRVADLAELIVHAQAAQTDQAEMERLLSEVEGLPDSATRADREPGLGERDEQLLANLAHLSESEINALINVLITESETRP